MKSRASSDLCSALSKKMEICFTVVFVAMVLTCSESALTSTGTDFVLAFPPPGSPLSFSCLVLTNPSSSAHVNVTVSAPLLTSYDDVTLVLSSEEVRILEVGTDLVMTSGGDDVEDKGMRVSSDRDLVVQMITQTESTSSIISGGATLIHSTASLQGNYRVVNRCNQGDCYLIVVETGEGTTEVIIGVRMTDNQGGAVMYFEGIRHKENDPVFRTIEQFQVMQLLCPATHCAMSGTVVLATQPIAVFVASETTAITYSKDLMMEQVPPVARSGGIGNDHNPVENYTYIVIPIVPGDHSSVAAVEEVEVVVDEGGTTVWADTGEAFTANAASETYSFFFGSNEVMTLKSDGFITVAQYTDAGSATQETLSRGDEAFFMPIPLSHWGSTVLLAAPASTSSYPYLASMSLTLVVASWQSDCLRSSSGDVLQDLLVAASKAKFGQVAVLRTAVTSGQTGVLITSKCGPMSGFLFSWSFSKGWVLPLAVLGAEYEVNDTTTTTTAMESTTETIDSTTVTITTAAETTNEITTTQTPTTDATTQPETTISTTTTPTTTTTTTTEMNMTRIPAPIKLCSCTADTHAILASLETAYKNQLTANDTSSSSSSFSSSLAEEASKNASAGLSVEEESLSKTRRAKFSEGDRYVAYGIASGLAVVVTGMLAHSVYSAYVHGPNFVPTSRKKQTLSSKKKKRRKEKKNVLQILKKAKSFSAPINGQFVLDSGRTVQECWF